MTEFTLLKSQVPAPPYSRSWSDILRWMVCVMDPSDTRLAFIASCFSYSIKNNGDLSDAQAKACGKIVSRVYEAYRDNILICQNSVPEDRSGLNSTPKE